MVVDERFERAHIEHRKSVLPTLGDQRERRQKSGLRLAGGGRCRDQDVRVAFQNGPDGLDLNGSKLAPVLSANPSLNGGIQAVKGVRRLRGGA